MSKLIQQWNEEKQDWEPFTGPIVQITYKGFDVYQEFINTYKNGNDIQKILKLELDFENQEIKDSDVKEIKDIIKQLNHLELIQLYLGCNQITDMGLAYIKLGITSLINLKHVELGLQENQITDGGIKKVCEMLENSINIQILSLYLSETLVTDNGILEIVKIFQNKKLLKITLALQKQEPKQVLNQSYFQLMNYQNNQPLNQSHLTFLSFLFINQRNNINDQQIQYMKKQFAGLKQLKSVVLLNNE